MNPNKHFLKVLDRRPILLTACLCAAFLIVSPVYGQFSSGFTGTVVDQSGAVVPNARITATDLATNVTSVTKSGPSGDFRVSELPGGVYRVVVETRGFKSWVRSGILLESNQTKTLYPVLTPGETTTLVQVSGTVAAIETAKSNTSREINEATIDTAPLLGRNVYTGMLMLAPGITGSGLPSGGGVGSSSTTNDSFEQEPAYQINAAGHRQEDNEYQIDGAPNTSNSRDGVVNLTPEPDFVQAIRVTSANFTASQGRYAGALIQVFTKAGTNKVHGSLSEFHTDNALTGRTIFETCPPGEAGCQALLPFRRNELGGSIGGPIIKNKLFLYGGLFVLRSSNASTQVATVESPQFAQWVAQSYPKGLANIFLSEAPPASPPTTGFLTASQLEQISPGFYPVPGNLPSNMIVAGIGFFSQSPPHNGYQWHVRGDYHFNSDKDRLFLEMFDTFSNQEDLDPRPIYRYFTPSHGVHATIDWMHDFSPTMLNDVAFTAYNADGSQTATVNELDLPNVSISAISGFQQWGPSGWVNDNFNWHDMLIWTHGKHTVETGIDIDRKDAMANFTNGDIRPDFYFANLLDFAQDLPFSQYGPTLTVSNRQVATNLDQIARIFYVGAYLQDDWKLTRRLTLNLGGRLDYFGHWASRNNSGTAVPFFTPGAGSTFAEEIAKGSMALRGGNSGYLISNTPYGLSPRVGFGWDVFGNGTTALRGGYGLFYNNIDLLSFTNPAPEPPPIWATPSFSVFDQLSFSYGLGSPPGSDWPIPPLEFVVNSAGGLGPGVGTYGVQPIFNQPRTQNWMVAVERNLGKNLVVAVDYNGSHSSHLYLATDVNRFPGDLVINKGNLTRLNPNFGSVVYGRTIGVADGELGTIMLTKRFSQRWQMTGMFTFGKSTDDLSSNDNGTDNGEAVFNPQEISVQHGLSDFDAAKRFTLDSVVEIPTPFKSRIAKALFGGWRMSHIVVLQSGLPFTVYTSAPFSPIYNAQGDVIGENPGGGDYNADGYAYDVPNTPSFGNNISTNRSDFIKGFAPASAFPMPVLGKEGNLGRNTFIGPGMANINSEFAKPAKIPWFTPEGATLEFRVDIFNLFNRVNLTNPISDLSSSLFGQSTTQNLPRSTQFGIHISF